MTMTCNRSNAELQVNVRLTFILCKTAAYIAPLSKTFYNVSAVDSPIHTMHGANHQEQLGV